MDIKEDYFRIHKKGKYLHFKRYNTFKWKKLTLEKFKIII